ncbi:sugar phosphate isomerase/epimerase family protein [Donghicola mangrovi]|uniref:Sugar phosphate isomerase/epimerase n=1 Tax=Donghicola mangrovi TaxID=2729614 RepID=A0A850Q5M3_9RHOB|nr:sugar phosphate isomerase/epimerase [Donghicola mangrovi]NVO25017.1 sugar phosphate isomerase/epimerase [Donghicola mangrovi]
MPMIKGPAIFLAQFAGTDAPFDTLENIAGWAAGLGYKGIQVPCDPRFIDLDRAADSKDYCDELKGICADKGVEITELSTHIQGQLVAVHPAFAPQFDGFAPEALRGKPQEQAAWAAGECIKAAKASRNMGLDVQVGFSGALAWPYLYPWPQRPAGLVEEAFAEIARRWKPILDAHEDQGVDYAYEIHPGEDLMDGASFERFVDAVDGHARACINYDPSHFVLQQLDYLGFIDLYHERIKAFHVKDAEFNPTARQGVYSGFETWANRAGRFRSLGDGQVDFAGIFSKLTQYGYDGWAVLEWECAIKSPAQGAAEGAPFIAGHIIEPTPHAFDDFAGAGTDRDAVRRMLGICA